MINAQSYIAKVRAKIKSVIEKNSKFDGNNLIKIIMFEKFIERVNKSNYKDIIFFKGGFILAHKFNVWDRSSGDLDYTIKLNKIHDNYKEEVYKIVQEICNINLNDGMMFEPYYYGDILKNQEGKVEHFEGIRIKFDAKLFKFTVKLTMDIQIIDKDLSEIVEETEYKSLDVLGDTIKIKEHNLTSIVSDKVSAILNHSINGTRMRDYYDIWLIDKTLEWKTLVDFNMLNKLLNNKIENKSGLIDNIDLIFNDLKIKERWGIYKKQFVPDNLNFNFLEVKNILLNILQKSKIIK